MIKEETAKKFIDSRIRCADTQIEIVPFLLERINKSKSKLDKIFNETALHTQKLVIDVCLHRINQILELRQNEKISQYRPNKLLNLLNLKDKLDLKEKVETPREKEKKLLGYGTAIPQENYQSWTD